MTDHSLEINPTKFNFGNIKIPVRWHEAGVFKCISHHSKTNIEHKAVKHHSYLQKATSLSESASKTPLTPPAKPTIKYKSDNDNNTNTYNMTSRKYSTTSASSLSSQFVSVINAFDEDSSHSQREFEAADAKAQNKLYKKVYGTMLKNNLVVHDDQKTNKHVTEKKPIDAYNAEVDCNSNTLIEIKSTKVQNSISNQQSHPKRATLQTFERSHEWEINPKKYQNNTSNNTEYFKNNHGQLQSIPASTGKIPLTHSLSYTGNTQETPQHRQNITPHHQDRKACNPNTKLPTNNGENSKTWNQIQQRPSQRLSKSTRDSKRRENHTQNRHSTKSRHNNPTPIQPRSPPRIPIQKQLRIHQPNLHMNKPQQQLTTFGMSSEHPPNHSAPHPHTARLESRLSTSSIQSNNSQESSSPFRDQVFPKLGVFDLRRIPTAQNVEVPPPDPPHGRARNHVIFMCVLLAVITVAVVCAVWFVTQGQGEDDIPDKTPPRKYDILKANVVFQPSNRTLVQTKELPLEKMETMMSMQIDEMFLRSNLSTQYCCNTIKTSRGSSYVNTTITLVDDSRSTNPDDVMRALESLVVVAGHHSNKISPELLELPLCLSCTTMEYGSVFKRPKILLFNLNVV